jgi:hypothetical protein
MIARPENFPGQAHQTSFDLREEIVPRLVDVGFAAKHLRRKEHNIVQTLIPNGLLLWAFNIARHENSRREIRILIDCIDDYKSGRVPQEGWRNFHNEAHQTFSWVVSRIIPARQEIRSYDLAEWFDCDRSHISHLVKDGTLRTTRAAVGCKSAIIERQSIVDFLKARRITS